jgi:hypothetical protein
MRYQYNNYTILFRAGAFLGVRPWMFDWEVGNEAQHRGRAAPAMTEPRRRRRTTAYLHPLPILSPAHARCRRRRTERREESCISKKAV